MTTDIRLDSKSSYPNISDRVELALIQCYKHTRMQVPTEELKKVDFSKIKLKKTTPGPAVPEGSTTDVFLARP